VPLWPLWPKLPEVLLEGLVLEGLVLDEELPCWLSAVAVLLEG